MDKITAAVSSADRSWQTVSLLAHIWVGHPAATNVEGFSSLLRREGLDPWKSDDSLDLRVQVRFWARRDDSREVRGTPNAPTAQSSATLDEIKAFRLEVLTKDDSSKPVLTVVRNPPKWWTYHFPSEVIYNNGDDTRSRAHAGWIASFLTPSEAARNCTLMARGQGTVAGRPVWHVRAIPRDRTLPPPAVFDVWATPGVWSLDEFDVAVDRERGTFLRVSARGPSGPVRIGEVEQIVFDSAIDAALFTFDVPPGVRVVPSHRLV